MQGQSGSFAGSTIDIQDHYRRGIQQIPLALHKAEIPVIAAVIAAYLLACIIDYAVVSRTLKIAVASVAALVSVVIGSIMVRSMTMVCDPVHIPDTPTEVPTIISTIGPGDTPPMIFDPLRPPTRPRSGPPGGSPPTAAIG